ncbi:MAG: hypothetical protein HRF49_00875 [bacterium]|jgi:galactokinase
MENLSATAGTRFTELFAAPPEVIFRAPGRVNIIGDHTDYLGGFCLPMAIGPSLYAAAGRNMGVHRLAGAQGGEKTGGGKPPHSQKINVASELFTNRGIEPVSPESPGSYPIIAAVLAILAERGFEINGCSLHISGDLPVGAGLSSSAALAMGTLGALDAMFSLGLSADDKIEIATLAERRAGTPCGWMDPAVIAHARAGQALLLDCYHREFEEIPLGVLAEMGYAFAVIFSGVRRDLSDGRYASLRARMESVAAKLKELDERVSHPRVLGLDAYPAARERLDETDRIYLDHFFLENERVKTFRSALEHRNPWQAGNLMFDSHGSLCSLGCGTPETDWLVERLAQDRRCLGARVTGAGWGGCVIALLSAAAIRGSESLLAAIWDEGRARFGRKMPWFVAEPGDGAGMLQIHLQPLKS